MTSLYYNPTTKVVFGSDAAQDPSIEAITSDKIPDLIANGATVDASANYTSAPAGGLGNDSSSTTGTASESTTSSATSAVPTPVEPASSASSTTSANNPVTEDTVIPTTSTPVTQPVESSESQSPAPSASSQDSDSAGSAAPVSADVPVTVSTVETKTYADGAVATGTNPPDVSPLDNTSPVVTTQPGANNPIVVGASSAATESDPLHVRIASHLEAIYQLAKATAPVTDVATPEGIGEIKDHAESVLDRIRNGISVTEGEVVQKLEKLVTLLKLL